MNNTAGQISYIAFSQLLYYITYGLHIAIATAASSIGLFGCGGIGVFIRKRRTAS